MAELIDKGALLSLVNREKNMNLLTEYAMGYVDAINDVNNMIDVLPTTTEAEIRASVIDEFVNAIEEYYFEVEDSKFRPYLKGINLVSEFNIRKIAGQLKGE